MAQRLSLSNKQKVLFGAGIIIGLTGVGIGIYQSRKKKKILQKKNTKKSIKS